jgi:hypothetical protein
VLASSDAITLRPKSDSSSQERSDIVLQLQETSRESTQQTQITITLRRSRLHTFSLIIILYTLQSNGFLALSHSCPDAHFNLLCSTSKSPRSGYQGRLDYLQETKRVVAQTALKITSRRLEKLYLSTVVETHLSRFASLQTNVVGCLRKPSSFLLLQREGATRRPDACHGDGSTFSGQLCL